MNTTKMEPQLLVSIHAPAGGATMLAITLIASHPSFNPRARRGRDKR